MKREEIEDMNKYLKVRLALIFCLSLCFSVLSVNLANAQEDPPTTGGRIEGKVFCDGNNDGMQDETIGEYGLEGIKVQLIPLEDVPGVFLRDAFTDTEGWYGLDEVVPGHYRVKCEIPVGIEPGLHCPRGIDFEMVADMRTLTYNFCFLCGDVIPPDEEECNKCDGKVTELALQFTGDNEARVQVVQADDNFTVFDANVEPEEIFSISGVADDNMTLGREIIINVGGVENARIHTSCSELIYTGLVSGSFELISGRSFNGGLICPYDEDDDCSSGDDDSSEDGCSDDGCSHDEIRCCDHVCNSDGSSDGISSSDGSSDGCSDDRRKHRKMMKKKMRKKMKKMRNRHLKKWHKFCDE